ncbi:COG1361 family protein [Aureliella helgolandensis]|uniref:hypothetical protein n=1 Tax=Aureliella helgolandensis TaxID=2527968 RepID=UPI0011A9DEEC|nr:hypothetical protein [Aureliella helgolandensis]
MLPAPAFTTPPTPPPCLDGSTDSSGFCNLLDHKKGHIKQKFENLHSSPGKAGEIQLTPLRVVAPVGGEVVLMAGICGPDGHLVNREPLEWMLSPDSVGTFIEVGDDQTSVLTSLLHPRDPKVEKLDVDFARGRTSHKATKITRGSPQCNDDIELREGQTWLSISSPSEGISRVTVLAPESQIWDRRRQTATVYWVDAQWQFPQPATARSGSPVQLVTRVTKAENLVPAEDWLVKYTIVDPSVAAFTPATGGNELIAKVNSDGQAIANLVAGPNGRGTTAILIDVVRPAQPSDNLPELRLGSGQSLVTFSAPGLALQAFGPQQGALGEPLTYVASLGNPGDVDVENAQLRMLIPEGTRALSVVPNAQTQTNTGIIWDQGTLASGRQLDVEVVLEAFRVETFQVVFEARGEPSLNAQKTVGTEIVEASVEARFEPAGGIAEAEVGSTVLYEIEIKNTSRQTLTDLRLLLESSPGLPEASQGQNTVEQRIAVIRPGETHRVGVNFRIQQQGQHSASLKVLTGEKLLAEKSSNIQGLPARPKQPDIGISIEFPQTIQAGSINNAVITLRNPGEVKLTDIKVNLTLDPSLRATQVDRDNLSRFQLGADGNTAVWQARDLLPRLSGDSGDMIWQLFVTLQSRAAVQQGTLRVSVTAAEGVQAEASTNFAAISRTVDPPAPVTPPAPTERTGAWRLILNGLGNPTTVNKEYRYALSVRNEQNQIDRNLHLEMRLSEGVRFLGVTSNGATVQHRFGSDGTITFPVVNSVRANEQLEYTIVVVPTVPQTMLLRARAYSDGRPEAVETLEQTTVNPQ